LETGVTELGKEPVDGNPVFTFRAGFRAAAGVIQRWAALLGFTCLLVGGATWMVAAEGSRAQNAGCWQFLVGLGLIVAGILWGFWWRGHLRAEFRRKFSGS
jgi:hypothetical protein